MTTYGLVNPDNEITRWDARINPNVQTKAGWRWLPLHVEAMPPGGQFQSIASSDAVEADRILRSWTVTTRDPTVGEVKAEAQRRIVALVGAVSLEDCIVKQLNASMRANELNDIRHDRALTDAEAAEAATLRALAATIKAIRTASNGIEALSPIPTDYAANTRWPA